MEVAETVIITIKVSRESIETCMKYSARLVSAKFSSTKETQFYSST